LQKLISDLSLNDIIELKGYIPNSQVPQVLNTFDIFCVTSIMNSESFGVAAVEAMAAKLPVVATDVDGFKEVVQDRVTGIIVEKGNINMIANAILELIENSQLRCSYGQAGYKRVTDLYDWDKNVKKMEKIYLSMLDKGE
ncbi:glycosyltransferase family 4 protein, partial [Enterococcus faecium]|nr:glycosyltransferase family 4 protein [Enterococcus faecium]